MTTAIPPLQSAAALMAGLANPNLMDAAVIAARPDAAVSNRAGNPAPTPAATPAVPDEAMMQLAAVNAAVARAAPRQGGLAPLLADLAQAVRDPALPPAARAAAGNVLALVAPNSEAVDPAAVRKAFGQSGLFLEARLAEAGQGASVPPPPTDMKAALLVLRQVLAVWTEAQPVGLPGDHDADDAAAGVKSATSSPPPPYHRGPTAGQAPAQPALLPGTRPDLVSRVLMQETEAALARQELLQIASLPEASEARRPAEERAARWTFDMPFMTPQGAAVAQFEISRDGGGGASAGHAPVAQQTWRARFSIDLEPLGPVHVNVALTGDTVRVGLWAERPAATALLRAHEPRLGAALRQADLVPEVAFHGGAPDAPKGTPGQFLDRAT